MATTDLNTDDPTFQRVRQRLQNTITDDYGALTPDRLGSFLNDLDGAQRQALMEEFKDQLPAGFMDRANRAAGAMQQNMAEGGSAHLLDSFNKGLDDFASLDRDNEGMLMRGARGLANIPLWATQGLQTAGEGIHDIFEEDESKHLNQGTWGEQLEDVAGAFSGGLAKQGGKTLWKTGKNLLKSPGKLNPFSKAGRQALSRNKAGVATVAAGGGTGIALGGGNPDGMQNIKVNPDGSVGVAPNAPTGTQVPNVFTENGMTGATQASSAEQGQSAPPSGFEGPLNAARSMGELDPRDKTPGSFQERNIQKGLIAESSRRLNNQIKEDKIQDRRDASAKHKTDLLEDRYDSTGGRMPGAWAALSPEQKAQMAQNYQTNSYYNSADEARKESLEALEKSGGSFVDPNDPTNQNKLPGQVSKEEFSKNTGLTQEGTGITQNRDGSYATIETGKAFENAGGLDSARSIFNPPAPTGNFSQSNAIHPYRPANADAALANLERQTEGGDKSYRAEFGEGPDLSPDTVRLSSDMVDYADAGFQNKEDALNYLNRGAVNIDNPAPAPAESDEEDGWFSKHWEKLLPVAALPLRKKLGYRPKVTGRPGTPFPRAPKPDMSRPGLPNKVPASNAPQITNNMPQLPNRTPALATRKNINSQGHPAIAQRSATAQQFQNAAGNTPAIQAARNTELQRRAVEQQRRGYGPLDDEVIGYF